MKKLFQSALLAASMLAAIVAPAFAQNATINGTIIVTPGTATEGASYTSTLNNKAGVITVSPIVVGPGGSYTETITNSAVSATDVCQVTPEVTTGKPVVTRVAPGAGSLAIDVFAANSQALSGSLKLRFICFK